MGQGADELFETIQFGRILADGEWRRPAGELRGMLRARRGPVPFSPVPRVAVRAGSIWTVDGYESELTLRDREGNAVQTVELPWSVRPGGDLFSRLEAELARQGKRHFLDELQEVPRPDEFPAVGGLLVDDRGWLWIKKYEPPRDALWLRRNALEVGPGGEWWVLEPAGGWVAKVRLPDDVVPLDVRGDRLLGVRRGAFGVETVALFSIEGH